MAGKGSPPGVRLGGRKVGTPNKATRELRELAQPYAPEALEVLAKIMRNGESEQARVAAANALLDRGHGKPAQSIHTTGTLTVEAAELNDAELYNIARGGSARAAVEAAGASQSGKLH